MIKTKSIILMIGIFLATCPAGNAQQPLRLDFEMPSTEEANRPWGWDYYSFAPNITVSRDSTEALNGNFSLTFTGEETDAAEAWHTLAYWISPWGLKGQEVNIEGWWKAEKLKGKGMITLEAWGPGGLLSADTSWIPLSNGSSWASHDLKITVGSSAYSLILAVSMAGSGALWFDSFSLSTHGKPLPEVPIAAPLSEKQLQWMAQQTEKLNSSQPDKAMEADAGLKTFAHIARDARIIALGESTHGTSEFFSMKHRLLQYAIKELGVSVFAIEANQLAVEQINSYVLYGEGTARKAMKALFQVWNTEEMLGLVEWMRSYNEKKPEQKVEFVGFDMQDPRLPIDSICAFLADYEPEMLPKIEPLLTPFREAWQKQPYPYPAESIREIWKDNAEKVHELITAQKAGWQQAASTATERRRLEWAVQNARVIQQAALSAFTQDLNDRDRAMAENIGWILDRRPADTRVLVWAHDAHISRGETPNDLYNYFGGGSMGSVLAEMYGEEYRAFGLSTYQGEYSGTLFSGKKGLVPIQAFPAPVGSLDEALHQIARQRGANALIFNLQPARKKPEAFPWLFEPRPVRFIGYAASDYSYEAMIAIPYQFDGLIFVDETRHSKVF